MTRRRHGLPRMARAWSHLVSQETARTNAAEASAELRERRHEQDEVDAYLGTVPSPITDAR
jgi:hypothetical protein